MALHLLATEPQGGPDVVEVLAEAARRSLARAAPESAVAYLRRALREPPPAAVRLDLLELLVTAAARAGRSPLRLEDLGFDPLEELAADPDYLVRSAIELARMLMATGRFASWSRCSSARSQVAEAAGDLDLAIRLHAWLSSWDMRPPAEARARFARYHDRVAPGSPGSASRSRSKPGGAA